jgi:2-dehydropantoate 2-reductase
MNIKKIAIMGAGAIGCYYGSLLIRTGYDVTLIARGANLQTIKNNGLKIKSYFGNFTLPHVKVTDKPAEVGPVDFIFFTVKTYDSEIAAKAMVPMITDNTGVLGIQNTNMAEKVGKIIGMQHILGGVTYVYSAMESPGVINQTSNFHKIILGEFSGKETLRAKAIFNLFKSATVTTILTNNIQKEIWSKLLFIGPSCGISSVVRTNTGNYREIPEVRKMLICAMKEIEAIAYAKRIKLDKDIVQQKIDFIDGLSFDSTTSMQRDILNNKKSELEELIGFTIQMGKEVNVSTPIHEFIYAALKPREVLVRKQKIT